MWINGLTVTLLGVDWLRWWWWRSRQVSVDALFQLIRGIIDHVVERIWVLVARRIGIRPTILIDVPPIIMIIISAVMHVMPLFGAIQPPLAIRIGLAITVLFTCMSVVSPAMIALVFCQH